MAVQLPPLLIPERINLIKRARSQKFIFDELTSLLIKGQSEISKHDVFDALIMREKLGSTCIGSGISIPRAHVNITNPRVALLILKKGLPHNSIDKKPITIYFSILIPNKDKKKFSLLMTELNQLLIVDKHIKIFDTIKSPELLSKHFEALLEKLILKTNIQEMED